jgi:hypothetical protein
VYAGDCQMTTAFVFAPTKTTVRKSGDGALLYTGPLAINIDGAPNAYHPMGRPAGARDSICNGANAILPDGSRLRGDKNCGEFIKAFAEARDSGWTAEGKPRVEWFGVANKGDTAPARFQPCVQESGPFQGFFVSTTALTADPGKGRCDPERYVNPYAVPYFVLPANSEFPKLGMKKGDVAVAVLSGTPVFAVYADVGPPDKLGEGSLALSRLLKGQPLVARPGEQDVRTAPIGSGVSFLMFPGPPVGAPYTLERIAQTGREKFQAWGGMERLKACLER